MPFHRLLLFSVILLIGSEISFGQSRLTENTLKLDDGSPSPEASMGDFAWLQGYWIGEGFGGTCEEAWMPPLGDTTTQSASMSGTFRMLEGGKLQFSEFFLLSRIEGRWTLRLKHFDAEMKSWEKQDEFTEFPLVRVQKNTVWFRGLTYRLNEAGKLEAIVAMKRSDGTYSEEKIVFQRKPL